tara:strand:+ start:352 stop:507 length:156 start_codon:yes stop_codon:yes gene_type:complete
MVSKSFSQLKIPLANIFEAGQNWEGGMGNLKRLISQVRPLPLQHGEMQTFA